MEQFMLQLLGSKVFNVKSMQNTWVMVMTGNVIKVHSSFI